MRRRDRPCQFSSAQVFRYVLALKRERNGNSDNILFIDASNDSEAGKNQNILRECDIDKIVETYERREDVDKYAHVAIHAGD